MRADNILILLLQLGSCKKQTPNGISSAREFLREGTGEGEDRLQTAMQEGGRREALGPKRLKLLQSSEKDWARPIWNPQASYHLTPQQNGMALLLYHSHS